MALRKLWTPTEDRVILDLVNTHGLKKWTLIASEMQKRSTQYHRSSKQIRQRWHNHLDPNVNKTQWTIQQQKVLFEAHRIYGSRWKDIASLLERRTDNYVKNHFYSTLRRALRRINKYLGQKNSTSQMRMIKPSILSYLIELADHDPEIRVLMGKIIEFSHSKPVKIDIKEEKDKNRETYSDALKKLEQINNNYIKRRQSSQKSSSSKKISNFCQKTDIMEDIKIQVKIQQQFDENEQVDQQNWENESSPHAKMLPEVEIPEAQYDLLDRKNDQDGIKEVYQVFFPSDIKYVDTTNLFQF